MDMHDSLRDSMEIIALRSDTIEDLAMRTEYNKEELSGMMEEARLGGRIVFFTLFRIEKLS